MGKADFLKGVGVAGVLGLAALLGISTAAHAATLDNTKTTSTRLNTTDRQFLMNAARTDMIESHEGQMAENQAARSDVKDMGKTLVTDHNQSYEQLSVLAAKDGVKIPKGINAARNSEIASLTHLNGNKFDSMFSKDEVMDHEHALAVFRREAASGHDPDVKAFATQEIPTLEKHLQLAKDCAAKHS